MAQYTGKREVLIFGQPQNRQVAEQWAWLQKETAGLKERDLLVLSAAGNAHLYRKYKVSPSQPFTVILVGKDGGEKFRAARPTPAQQLFDLVDAMPMRQAEMRRGKKGSLE